MMTDAVDQERMCLRRSMYRFFATRGGTTILSQGLCEHYERLGDDLVPLYEIIDWLATDGIDTEIVVTRFRLSARHGDFGRRPSGAVTDLLDLDNTAVPPAKYSIRPYWSRIEFAPQHMRARRSVWVRWVQEQGWAIPKWLSRPVVIDGSATEVPANLLGEPTGKRGPKAVVSDRIKEKMRQLDPTELRLMKQSELVATFGAAESTCRLARQAVLAEF